MTYDPFKLDYDAIEDAAQAIDDSPDGCRRPPIKDITRRVTLWRGDTRFAAVWAQVESRWRQEARKHGIPDNEEPTQIHVNVNEHGQPLTTHDESIRGDGRLADGVLLGTAVARARAINNQKHIIGIVNELRRLKQEGKPANIATLEQNTLWNWTKGRPARPVDPEGDVCHMVGEPYEHDPVSWDSATAELWWPYRKKKGKKAFTPTESSPL